jgi:3-deoxy-D-manno-octulosonic-acid transferase
MYALYTAVLAAAVTGYAPVAVARRLARGVPLHVRERLGLVRHERAQRPVGWIHAVSVGEAIAAAPLVEGLRRTWPALASSASASPGSPSIATSRSTSPARPGG